MFYTITSAISIPFFRKTSILFWTKTRFINTCCYSRIFNSQQKHNNIYAVQVITQINHCQFHTINKIYSKNMTDQTELINLKSTEEEVVEVSNDKTFSTTDIIVNENNTDVIMKEDDNVKGDCNVVVGIDEKQMNNLNIRTIQTQHGDYRSVDEENIVVLKICRSPVPEVLITDGENNDQDPLKFIWISNDPYGRDTENEMDCSVRGCTNRDGCFFRFPVNECRTSWVKFCGRGSHWEPKKNSRICQMHFESDEFKPTKRLLLQPMASPSLQYFIHKDNIIETTNVTEVSLASTSSTNPFSEAYVVQLQDKISNLERELSLLKKQILSLRSASTSQQPVIDSLRKKNSLLNVENNLLNVKVANISKFLNPDQAADLDRKRKRTAPWSEKTIKTALQIKFACGSTGYETLRTLKYPLPSNRTLSRRLVNLHFKPGIVDEAIELLKIKVKELKETDREVVLAIDEMSIVPGHQFDQNLGQFIGNITLPDKDQRAEKALIFVLGGIASRWKQVVAYHFTGNSLDGVAFHNEVLSIISAVENIGLRVNSIVTDMGACNMSLWKSFGVGGDKDHNITCSAEHPLDKNRRLYFFPDVIHVFKNITSGLVRNKCIWLSEETVRKFNLKSKYVRLEDIQDLFREQQFDQLKLIPKLTETCFAPNNFQKMRVATSTRLVNNSVSSALHLKAQEGGDDQCTTTAWFIGMLDRWFSIVKARSSALGISYNNIEAYNSTIQFLEDCMYVFRSMSIGNKWKPFQTGLLMATSSAIQVSKYLLDERNFSFVLLGRFTNDFVENIFSQVRSRHPKPSAVDFKADLRLISVSQYLHMPSNTSYSEDEREHLGGFLECLKAMSPNKSVGLANIETLESGVFELGSLDLDLDSDKELEVRERNALYHAAGYICHKLTTDFSTCDQDMLALGSRNSNTSSRYSEFSKLKTYHGITSDKSFFYVNDSTFLYFFKMEKIFRSIYSSHSNSADLQKIFTSTMKTQIDSFPTCHQLVDKIISKYFLFRVRISNSFAPATKKDYSSLSMSNRI